LHYAIFILVIVIVIVAMRANSHGVCVVLVLGRWAGSEAVEWIKTNFGIAREEAHWIGQTLFEWEFILSKSQSDFLDSSFNYYFQVPLSSLRVCVVCRVSCVCVNDNSHTITVITQDVEGAFDNSASASPKKVGQAVAHLLSLYTQVEGDLRTPKVYPSHTHTHTHTHTHHRTRLIR